MEIKGALHDHDAEVMQSYFHEYKPGLKDHSSTFISKILCGFYELKVFNH